MLREQVYTQTGIVLDGDKHYLFESRLTPIVRQLGLNSIDELCALMFSTPDRNVGRQVMEAMTTNETYFFRDPAHYDAIRTVLLPRLKQRKLSGKSFRSGRRQHQQDRKLIASPWFCLQEGLSTWDLQILATDYSSQVLDRARSGKYQQIEVNRGLPSALLVKHFRRSGVDWQLSEPVRQMVRFRDHGFAEEDVRLRALRPGFLPQRFNLLRRSYQEESIAGNPSDPVPRRLVAAGRIRNGFGSGRAVRTASGGNVTVYVAR